MARHVDYVRVYAANLTPVIPHDAKLAPSSTLDPASRGKVPGIRRADGWVGGWKHLGDATMERAKVWDEMGAGIGFRFGRKSGVCAIDPDLTVKADAAIALRLVHEAFGPKLAVRRVEHPEHHKFLVLLRMRDEMPRSFDYVVRQSDGSMSKVQFLGPGRYANIHGIHPGRLRPYVWENDPAETPLTLITLEMFEAFWRELQKAFPSARSFRIRAREIDREPETCSQEEAEFYLRFILNDEHFDSYDMFIAMGSALFGASRGAAWGRMLWYAWCDQRTQGDPDKPERFWDTMVKTRIGAEVLVYWANKRAPQEMARRAFTDPPIDEEARAEADEDAEFAQSFLERHCLVAGTDFYDLPAPGAPYKAEAFSLENAKDEKRLRRYFGGDKRRPLSHLFALHGSNIAKGATHHPGRPRFVDVDGRRFLNLWTAPARPHKGRPVDPEIIKFYREFVSFVLGADEEARLWFFWHAYLLQNPDKAPGWHWLVQTLQGLGKDRILFPFTQAHGHDYALVLPAVLEGQFNDYAQKHLISVSEMRERQSRGQWDVYTQLKAITSGNPVVPIHLKHRTPYLAPNVAAFVVYTNELRPFKISHEDRRFRVVSNFGATKRSAEYYENASGLLETHWAMIAEYFHTLPLSEIDMKLLRGNAPVNKAKIEMSRRAWEEMYFEIVGELESDDPPPGYLPIATTTDLIEWMEKRKLPAVETPNRQTFPSDLYRLGARPLQPEPGAPARAGSIRGSRLWRIARTWRDQQKTQWNIEAIAPMRLARLYIDRSMPPPDLHEADDEDVV